MSDYPESLKPGRPKRPQDLYVCRACGAKWNGETGTRVPDEDRQPFIGMIPNCPRCRGEQYEAG